MNFCELTRDSIDDMKGEDREKLRNIVTRLKATLEELRELEKTSSDPRVRQIAISAEMALAWIDLISIFQKDGDNADYHS